MWIEKYLSVNTEPKSCLWYIKIINQFIVIVLFVNFVVCNCCHPFIVACRTVWIRNCRVLIIYIPAAQCWLGTSIIIICGLLVWRTEFQARKCVRSGSLDNCVLESLKSVHHRLSFSICIYVPNRLQFWDELFFVCLIKTTISVDFFLLQSIT